MLFEEKMKYKNQQNLVRCKGCNALYDKTIKWARGQYQGTSNVFHTAFLVKEDTCPICGEKHEQ